MRSGRVGIAAAIVVLPGLLLAPVWRLAGLGAGEDDVLYYFPSRVFLHETVAAGHWPWLNPWTGMDRPYAADPQSALWYPSTWLFVVLPPLWAYPISLWAHYSLALWGMYRLVRSLGTDRRAAVFGGVVFAFCGFLLAHRAHLAMQHAAAWTPWVFWRLRRLWGDGPDADRRTRRAALRFVWACVAVALQCFAGHLQVAMLTGLGSLVYLLAMVEARGGGGPTSWRRVVTRWPVVWICAGGLFAVQWLPTLDYLSLSTRVHRTYLDFVENSWNPVSALNYLLPMLFGQRTANFFEQPYWGPSHQCEQFGYLGIVPLLLAALALRTGWRADDRRRPWGVLLIFSLLLALGGFGPVCPLLYWIPGASLFRAPARALLLVDLSLAALAALVVHDLAATHTPSRVRLRAAIQRLTRHPIRTTLLLVGIPLLLVLLATPLLPPDARRAALLALRPWKPAVWVPALMILGSLLALLVSARRWQQPRWLWLPIALTGLDLGVMGWTIDVPAKATRPDELFTALDQPWVAALQESDQRLWVVTDTAGVYANPLACCAANTNMLLHLRSLSDYGPLQPRGLHSFFGFKPWGVTPHAKRLLRDTGWMRTCNVGWVLLCGPDWPAPADCDLVMTTPEGTRLYRNSAAAGMAFFENSAQPGAVHYIESGPQRFVVSLDTWPADGGGAAASDPTSWPRLVISRLAWPGWQARVDGQSVAFETADFGLLALRVPPGEPVEVEWSYFPPGLREGTTISGLTALVLLAVLGRAYLRSDASGRRQRG